LLREADLTEKNLRLMAEYDRRRNDPKQQLNNQIGESVRVKITVAEAATPGIRHLRVQTPSGLSNPMRFVIGQLPEVREAEPPPEFDLEHYRGGMDAVKQHTLVTPPPSITARHAQWPHHARRGG
jgi:hypothetical protein